MYAYNYGKLNFGFIFQALMVACKQQALHNYKITFEGMFLKDGHKIFLFISFLWVHASDLYELL